jgi:hypothetical protein
VGFQAGERVVDEEDLRILKGVMMAGERNSVVSPSFVQSHLVGSIKPDRISMKFQENSGKTYPSRRDCYFYF